MPPGKHPKRVEDYTTANLILVFVNLLWIFGVVWSTLGIGAVILLGWALNLLIYRLAIWRSLRAESRNKRGRAA